MRKLILIGILAFSPLAYSHHAFSNDVPDYLAFMDEAKRVGQFGHYWGMCEKLGFHVTQKDVEAYRSAVAADAIKAGISSTFVIVTINNAVDEAAKDDEIISRNAGTKMARAASIQDVDAATKALLDYEFQYIERCQAYVDSPDTGQYIFKGTEAEMEAGSTDFIEFIIDSIRVAASNHTSD